MPESKAADEVLSTNEYTFEHYDDPRETRAWFERFLLEHNGRNWQQKLKFSVTDLLTGNFPKAPNGETTRIFWYRIKYKGVLVGYADAKIHPIFNGRKIISDVWIIPMFRKRGHFHASFPALVEYTDAVGVCIMMSKYRLYGRWFESFGFEWLSAFGVDPSDDPEQSPGFLVTRDAYKDIVRFMLKFADGYGYPSSGRGKIVFEEVRKELENEDTGRC
ncbi:MAG: hypothetical protein ACJ8R9_31285 [Steroidobacteraceae bacterium]